MLSACIFRCFTRHPIYVFVTCQSVRCLPDSPKPDSPKLGFRVKVRVSFSANCVSANRDWTVCSVKVLDRGHVTDVYMNNNEDDVKRTWSPWTSAFHSSCPDSFAVSTSALSDEAPSPAASPTSDTRHHNIISMISNIITIRHLTLLIRRRRATSRTEPVCCWSAHATVWKNARLFAHLPPSRRLQVFQPPQSLQTSG